MGSHRTMNMDFALNPVPIKAIIVTPIVVEAVTFVVSNNSTSFLISIKTTLVAAINTVTVIQLVFPGPIVMHPNFENISSNPDFTAKLFNTSIIIASQQPPPQLLSKKIHLLSLFLTKLGSCSLFPMWACHCETVTLFLELGIIEMTRMTRAQGQQHVRSRRVERLRAW